MTVSLLYIRVFLNVLGEALALTTVTIYHPPLSPQTLLLSYKKCFQERNPNGQKVSVAYRSATDDKRQEITVAQQIRHDPNL